MSRIRTYGLGGRGKRNPRRLFAKATGQRCGGSASCYLLAAVGGSGTWLAQRPTWARIANDVGVAWSGQVQLAGQAMLLLFLFWICIVFWIPRAKRMNQWD
eukprot:2231081-Rhodomonas_salina.1